MTMPNSAIDERLVQQHRRRAAHEVPEGAGLLLFTPANILGFIGVPMAPSDRLVCGLLNWRGEAALVCPAFEKPESGDLPAGTRVWTWEEHADPFAAAATAAGSLGLSQSAILVDPRCWVNTLREL